MSLGYPYSVCDNNVVIFGESGGGKSSTVNLLLGREAVYVSDRAIGCTFEFQHYWADGFNLFDTVGLSEGSQETIKSSDAIKGLVRLLKYLENGVSLLIFVMERGRIKKSLDENYKLFAEAIFMRKVPAILVITHCEMEMEPGQWWRENKIYFDNYGMTFKGVISGCCMNPEKAPLIMRPAIKALNDSTVSQLRQNIAVNRLTPGWRVKGGWRTGLQKILGIVWQILLGFFPFWKQNEEPDLQTKLENYFLQQDYKLLVAKQMARDIANAM